MIVRIDEVDAVGRTRLALEATHYDACPALRTVLLSEPLTGVHPDRLAVGCALIAGPYTSGTLQLPAACAPVVARAIEGFLCRSEVRVADVDYVPRRLPLGSAAVPLRLCQGSLWPLTGEEVRDQPAEARDGPADPPEGPAKLVVANMSAAPHAADWLTVHTNAGLLAGDGASVPGAIVPLLGVAVLFAERLGAHSLVLSDGAARRAPNLLERVSDLLDSTSLRLIVSTEVF